VATVESLVLKGSKAADSYTDFVFCSSLPKNLSILGTSVNSSS